MGRMGAIPGAAAAFRIAHRLRQLAAQPSSGKKKKQGSGDGDAVIKSERGLGAASGSRAGSQAASLRRSQREIWD